MKLDESIVWFYAICCSIEHQPSFLALPKSNRSDGAQRKEDYASRELGNVCDVSDCAAEIESGDNR